MDISGLSSKSPPSALLSASDPTETFVYISNPPSWFLWFSVSLCLPHLHAGDDLQWIIHAGGDYGSGKPEILWLIQFQPLLPLKRSEDTPPHSWWRAPHSHTCPTHRSPSQPRGGRRRDSPTPPFCWGLWSFVVQKRRGTRRRLTLTDRQTRGAILSQYFLPQCFAFSCKCFINLV